MHRLLFFLQVDDVTSRFSSTCTTTFSHSLVSGHQSWAELSFTIDQMDSDTSLNTQLHTLWVSCKWGPLFKTSCWVSYWWWCPHRPHTMPRLYTTAKLLVPSCMDKPKTELVSSAGCSHHLHSLMSLRIRPWINLRYLNERSHPLFYCEKWFFSLWKWWFQILTAAAAHPASAHEVLFSPI